MRHLFGPVLTSLLFATSAFSESDQTIAAWKGVWTGSIGKLPITACFNDEGSGSVQSGSYYYHRHLIPIELSVDEGNATGGSTIWREADGDWLIHNTSSNQIDGTWTNKDASRKLPIKLARVALSAGDSADGMNPCGSQAYNKAIEASLQVIVGPTISIGNLKYRHRTIALLGGKKDVESREQFAESIEIIGDSPVVESINKSLRRLINDDHWGGCRFSAMNWRSIEGVDTRKVSVSTLGNWLRVTTSWVTFCGDRHQTGSSSYMWDMSTGKQESLFSWLKGAEATNDDERVRTEGKLPESLDKFIATRFGQGDPSVHLSRDDLVRCYGEYSPGAYSYQPELVSDGIDFNIPPTRNGSCGETIKLTFKELRPFLNQTGRRLVSEMQAAQKAKR